MRTGSDPSAPDDLLLRIPSPPIPAHANHVMTAVSSTSLQQQQQHTASPVMSTIPMEPMPANVMSPDDMLRAYAERKKSISASKPPVVSSPSSPLSSIISYPKALAKKASLRSSLRESGSNTMRVLYNAATRSLSPTETSDDQHQHHHQQQYHRYSAYGGMAAAQPNESSSATTIVEEEQHQENVAGMGVVGFGSGSVHGNGNAHPFGYHPYAYGGGGEEENHAGSGTGVGAFYMAQ